MLGIITGLTDDAMLRWVEPALLLVGVVLPGILASFTLFRLEGALPFPLNRPGLLSSECAVCCAVLGDMLRFERMEGAGDSPVSIPLDVRMPLRS